MVSISPFVICLLMSFYCSRWWPLESCQSVVALRRWSCRLSFRSILQCSFSWGPRWFHPRFLCWKAHFLISLDRYKYYAYPIQFLHCVPNSPLAKFPRHLDHIQGCRKNFLKTTPLKYQIVHWRLAWLRTRTWGLSLGLEPHWYFRLSLFGSGFWIILIFLIWLLHMIWQWATGS